MAIDKRLQVFDAEGNPVDYDILATDVKFQDGEDLPTKLAELEEEIGEGGYAPPPGGIPKTDLASSVQQTLDDVDNKVDKVTGKGLSTNDYTTADKNKLAGIAEGAEVNVQSDWDASSGDAAILNKPTILTQQQVQGMIDVAVEDLGNGTVESVTINGTKHNPDANGDVNLGTIVGEKGEKGDKGDTLLIDGNFDPVTDIVNDLVTGGTDKALSAEMGKELDERLEELELSGGDVTVSYNSTTKTTSIITGAGAQAETTPTPTITVADATEGKQVTIASVSGAVIYYTTDGSTPTRSSLVYTGPLTINTAGSHTIKAVAKVPRKLLSEVATETFTLVGTEQPTITTSETASSVTVTATLADATVYISLDNETWTSGNGSASLTINKTLEDQQVTVYAYAKASGMIASQVVTESITVDGKPNNIFSGTSSAALTAIKIGSTVYTNTASETDPYIVNTQDGNTWNWEIDFGDTEFGTITSGVNAKSIFYDGTTDNGNIVKKITHMPDSWATLGTYALHSNNLTSIAYGKNLTSINGNFAVYAPSLAVVENLPAKLTSIDGNPAFKVGEWASSVSITIPDTVTSIGNGGLSANVNITYAYIGAKNVGNLVLSASTGAKDIYAIFGPNVASIGNYIFHNRSSNSVTIEFLRTTPPSFTDQSKFLSNNQAVPNVLKIIVPQGSLAAYQSALSSFASYIEEKTA